jgi:dihydrofolate reductase
VTEVVAKITQSVDGYVAGPDDEPGKGLGEGGERLHYWVLNAFTFVSGLESALEQARAAAGDKDVTVMGGADTIRQALAGGHVDELVVTIAPVVLGGGKRLFEGFDQSIDLRQVEARQSEWATHLRHRVKK